MEDPLSEFLTIKKNPERWSGAAGYISSEEIFGFFNNQKSRPSNFLFQIARGSRATFNTECTFFYEQSAHHSWDFFKIWPLHGFTSKEPGPSLVLQAKPGKQGGLRVQPWNDGGLIEAGPTGFRNNVTTSHGPWPSPRVEARRGAASATPTPSRIG
jgi:hypothetical protein